MTAQTNKKNSSIKKRLVPATAMLVASAMALASSTYAWFTMSREAEVRNIQMTATVPEDLQISLGAIGSAGPTATLGMSTGYLSGTVASVPVSDYDWSNTADISHYYTFGKLMPASSNDGLNIFYSTDIAGAGRTLKPVYTVYQAAAAKQENEIKKATALGNGGISVSTKATAHIITSADDTWASDTYAAASSNEVMNDDGFYVDVPVWIRTAKVGADADAKQNIYVTGYVTSQTVLASGDSVDSDTDDLYKAVRVAVLEVDKQDATGENYKSSKGIIALKDGADAIIDPSTADGFTAHNSKFPTTIDTNGPLISSGKALGNGIVDSDNYSGLDGALSGIAGLAGRAGEGKNGAALTNIFGISAAGTNTAVPTWTAVTLNKGDTAVAALDMADTSGTYGNATKLILRVWIEGEDGNCWNANAGQDWNIALKFSTDQLPASTT